MDLITATPILGIQIEFRLDEDEARALVDLAGYGTEEFIQAFYDKLGRACMMQHKDGIRKLFKCIREQIPPPLAKLDEAWEIFEA